MFRRLFAFRLRRYTTNPAPVKKKEFSILSLTTPILIPIGMTWGIYDHHYRPNGNYVEGAICGGLTGWAAPILLLIFCSAIVFDLGNISRYRKEKNETL